MKKLLKFNLFLSAIVAGVLILSSFITDPPEYKAHPLYCNVWGFVANDEGHFYLCPDDLCYNPKTSRCDYPDSGTLKYSANRRN